jgi:TrmH family RNA methyltransferase
LVGTTHSGNLGAAARAMKTMAIEQLDCVALSCQIDAHAQAMAAHADDVLQNARHFNALEPALEHSTLTLGLTARPRRDGVPALTPREAAALVVAESGPVSVLFGRERTGLTNEELGACQRLVHIPANPDYPALNVASAVQLMAYEIYLAGLATAADEHRQIEAMIEYSGYSARQPREVLIRRLRNFINRARPSVEEVNLLRGVIKRLLP